MGFHPAGVAARPRTAPAVAEVQDLQKQLELLTEKEHEVLELLAQEKSTRAIAVELARLGPHRRVPPRRMMEKLNLSSPMQLFRFAIRALDGCALVAGDRVSHEAHVQLSGNGRFRSEL